MADFVLVHGAWHGAWCRQRVLPGPWAAGHRAFVITLGGVWERAHPLSGAITLETHIADVLGVIEAEELSGAVLVGHSYAGMVITGVADRPAGRAEARAARREAIARLGLLPPPDPAIFGLSGADGEWVARR